MEELQVIETTSGRQFKPWASREDVQIIKQETVQAVVQAVQNPASITAITSEIASGKQAIASAINAKGGEASATESFTELAQDIESIPLQVNELNTDMELSDVMAFINTKYNIPYKGYIAYMWEAVADTYTCILPTADLIVLSDGQTSTGGEVTIQLNPTQRFFFALLLYREGNTSATLTSIGTTTALNRVIAGGDMVINSISGFNEFNTTTLELGKNIVVGDLIAYAFFRNTHLCRMYIDLLTISGGYTFQYCTNLSSVEMSNLATISGNNTFYNCTNLSSVEMPNLATISGGSTFQNCRNLSSVEMPNLATISSDYEFGGCEALMNIIFGTLTSLREPFTTNKPNLRNITIGQDTNINLPFQLWTATNVIAEGQSGIDELNSNLYNNLLTKLYDHSNDGQTRTLRIGWLANVSAENIAYANAKGWTLTT